MNLIRATKKATKTDSKKIKRRWWSKDTALIIGTPCRIKKDGYDSEKQGAWNPTKQDIIAKDWEVVKE